MLQQSSPILIVYLCSLRMQGNFITLIPMLTIDEQDVQSATQLATDDSILPQSHILCVEQEPLEVQTNEQCPCAEQVKARANEHSPCAELLNTLMIVGLASPNILRTIWEMLLQMMFNLATVFLMLQAGLPRKEVLQELGPASHPPRQRVLKLRQMLLHSWLVRCC